MKQLQEQNKELNICYRNLAGHPIVNYKTNRVRNNLKFFLGYLKNVVYFGWSR